MATNVDNEIEAIRVILTALEPLDANARETVMDYVFKRLDMKRARVEATQPAQLAPPSHPLPPTAPTTGVHQLHIKDFKEEKQPRSAIEMAAIVAYYLEHLAPESDRKGTVETTDLDTYFKIAEFKLPTQQKFTLINARNAGYLDSVGGGEYKLNAVGHNLVVHSMPRKGSDGTTRRHGPKKRATKKKTAASNRKQTSK